MRIFDEAGKELQAEAVDCKKGRLVEDRLLITRHKAVEAVAEKGHWETVKEYPNGGKEVEWVVDVPAVEARDAWDEYEDIMRYIPFDEQTLKKARIAELKQLLSDTDYVVLKIVEGATTLDKVADTIAQRSAWRAEINKLESEV